MNKYFTDCTCIEQVKATYKKLALKYHPDINKDANATTIMQDVNNAYELAFERFKNVHMNSDGNTYTANTTTTETAFEFMEIINKLITLNGLKIELIGRWIWLSGDTYNHKEVIKSLDFRWSSSKKMWYWHKAEDKKRSYKQYGIGEIRDLFGSTEFKSVEVKTITA